MGHWSEKDLIEATCEYCGKPFARNRILLQISKRHFCSQHCCGLGKRKRLVKQCRVCGKDFETVACVRRSTCDDKTCKVSVHHGKYASHWSGGKVLDRDVNSDEYKQWRFSVFLRDNWSCRRCGISDHRMQAHHVRPWAKFPSLRFDVKNGVTVCKPCHRTIHRDKEQQWLQE